MQACLNEWQDAVYPAQRKDLMQQGDAAGHLMLCFAERAGARTREQDTCSMSCKALLTKHPAQHMPSVSLVSKLP